MALTKCKECGHEVSKKAEKCPGCGAPLKRKQSGCGTLLLILLIGGVLVAVFGANESSNSSNPSSAASTDGSTSSSASRQDDYQPRRAPAPPLLLLSFKCQKEYSYVFITGEVKNVSNSRIKNVTAVATFRDSDGDLVKSEDALIDYNPILPGQSSPFKAGGTDNPAIKSCNVSFKHLLGGSIAYTSREQLTEKIQTLLADAGYEPGPADGKIGPSTRAAIKKFEQAQDLPVTGKVSTDLLRKLKKLSD